MERYTALLDAKTKMKHNGNKGMQVMRRRNRVSCVYMYKSPIEP